MAKRIKTIPTKKESTEKSISTESIQQTTTSSTEQESKKPKPKPTVTE